VAELAHTNVTFGCERTPAGGLAVIITPSATARPPSGPPIQELQLT
jgi:hypothetical protein